MFKILDKACTPTRGSKYSACVDLYAREDVIIGVGDTAKIPLGVCIDNLKIREIIFDKSEPFSDNRENNKKKLDKFLKSHCLLLEPRSSLRVKGLIVGSRVINLDYPDEIKMSIHNAYRPYKRLAGASQIPDTTFIIKKGDKIAQIALLKHKSYLFGIDAEEERTGGIEGTGEN